VSERRSETADERLAANVRLLRERRGMSQRQLAEAMAERGHPWHQQTVGRVEEGNRPVRFAEAEDLAAILQAPLDRLAWASGEARVVEYLNQSASSVTAAHEAVADSVRRLLGAVAAVEEDAKRNEGHRSPLVQEARRDALGRVAEYGSVDDAVAEGYRRREYEERQGR
jgi:transcriptional regulator with XRE-family HTH domain